MHGFTTFVLAALPLAAVGTSHHGAARRHRAIHVPRAGPTYDLTDSYKGKSFFDNWYFFTGTDPTSGFVTYLAQNDAQSKGLAYVGSDNVAVIAVDSTTHIGSGANRDSVRISSKKLYSGGLFIADFAAMPTGCGTWPAWWSAGPDWPNAGELDIIEGVNGMGTNQMTLHSGAGNGACTLTSPPANNTKRGGLISNVFSGHLLGTNCISSNDNDAGCAILDTDTRSFASGFNNASGGVFAHLWDDSGIKIWHFARNDIPQDITTGQPNPSSWPTPTGSWSSTSCNIKDNFHSHALTLNIDVCGSWAGGVYGQSTCPGTCADAVADPTHFADAQWKINYISVYNGVVTK